MITFIGGWLAWHGLSWLVGLACGVALVQAVDDRVYRRGLVADAEREAKLAAGRANQERGFPEHNFVADREEVPA